MTGSKFVPSIKNIVICISSCEGKYPHWHNAKLFFLKSQRGRLRVQWNTINSGGVYMGKLAPARVSYRDYFVISYHVYMMTGSFHTMFT